MSRPQKHTVQSTNGKYNYLLFDSVFAFNAFVDHEIQQLNKTNASRWNNVVQSTSQNLNSGTDWYGNPTPKDIEELNEHRTFSGMELVQKIQPQIKDKLAKYLDYLEDVVLPKPKMAYNDRGLGVFSFERAAMAMFKNFPVDTRTPVNTAVSQMSIELNNHSINTSVKTVYAYFRNKQMSYPAMQLYIMAGANANVQGDQLLYVGLACAELVEFTELRGISVEVNVMLGTSFSNQVAMACVRVKRFQDKLEESAIIDQ